MGLQVEDGMRSPWRGVGWFLIWCGVGVVGLGVVWGCWCGVAVHRLKGVLGEMRGRGEATTGEELVEGRVEGKSGYAVAMEACGALSLDREEAKLVNPTSGPGQTVLPLSAKEMALGRRMVAEQGKVLAILEELRAVQGVGYPLDPKKLTPWTNPGWGKFRDVANFLRMAALVHHSMGDERAAMADLDKAEMLAGVVAAGPFVINQMMAMEMRIQGDTAWLHLAPDLQLRSERHPGGLEREAWMREIEKHMDDTAENREMSRGLMGERATMLAEEAEAEKRVPHLIPMLRLDAARTCTWYGGTIDVTLRGENYATASATGKSPEYRTNVMDLSHSIEAEQFTEWVIKLHFHSLCMGDGVAIRLALRLYELERGREAGSLSELAPGYLKKVPVDPFRADGGAWGYSLKKRVFYSVNVDGVDNGGEGMAARMGQATNWRGKDACFPLDRVVAAAGGATTGP